MSRSLLFYGQALKILLICHFDEAFFVADPVSKLDMNVKRVSHGSVFDQFLVGWVQFLLVRSNCPLSNANCRLINTTSLFGFGWLHCYYRHIAL